MIIHTFYKLKSVLNVKYDFLCVGHVCFPLISRITELLTIQKYLWSGIRVMAFLPSGKFCYK